LVLWFALKFYETSTQGFLRFDLHSCYDAERPQLFYLKIEMVVKLGFIIFCWYFEKLLKKVQVPFWSPKTCHTASTYKP